MGRYLVCVTGASGGIYAVRTLRALAEAGMEIHLAASEWGGRVLERETGASPEEWARRTGIASDRVYGPADLAAPVSSGSFRLDGTVVVPCSMSTAGALASGTVAGLVQRAGAVALKEGWPLVLVPRETPLSLVDLRNLTALAEAGAAILPACPGFYNRPSSLDDLADFMAGRILDRLGVPNSLFRRWGAEARE